MADKEERDENTTRGNDWEVVSLTASAYTASPGPKEVKLKDDDKDVTCYEAETSHPLFMSRHFVFPPSDHENLSLQLGDREILEDKVSKKIDAGFDMEEEAMPQGKEEGDMILKGLNLSVEYAGLEFLDEKGKREESIYDAAISSLHEERSIGGSNVNEEKESVPEQTEPLTCVVPDIPPSLSPTREDKKEASSIPCEAWWRRSVISLSGQAKEANALWSIFIAAAVMGLVMLGQQWQQERLQVLQRKWQSSIGNEKSLRMSGVMSRLKEALIGGGQRRGSFIGTNPSHNN